MYIHKHTYIHIYIHIYTHIYLCIHTYIHICVWLIGPKEDVAWSCFVTWPLPTCDMTHSYVWLDSFICVPWVIHMCVKAHSYVFHATQGSTSIWNAAVRWHDSSYTWLHHFICVSWLCICLTWLMHLCDKTHACVWHDSCMCVTRLMHVCDMKHACVWLETQGWKRMWNGAVRSWSWSRSLSLLTRGPLKRLKRTRRSTLRSLSSFRATCNRMCDMTCFLCATWRIRDMHTIKPHRASQHAYIYLGIYI